MAHAAETDDPQSGTTHGLTPEEDMELRQLTWFSRAGSLSEQSLGRMAELIRKDRRTEVRDARPNPSTPAAEEVTTLPPLQLDAGAEMTCPNCGALIHPGTASVDPRHGKLEP